MEIKNALNIMAGLALVAFSPLTRAQCPQVCDGNKNIGFGDLALEETRLHAPEHTLDEGTDGAPVRRGLGVDTVLATAGEALHDGRLGARWRGR